MAELVDRIDGIVHEPTQVQDDGRVDLTVSAVYRVSEPGRIDFGGSELEEARLNPVETALRSAEDEYGWWHLGADQYVIEYNESLRGAAQILVQTRRAARERGISHPTLHVSELVSVPLSVGGAGIQLKENARVSTAVPQV